MLHLQQWSYNSIVNYCKIWDVETLFIICEYIKRVGFNRLTSASCLSRS